MLNRLVLSRDRKTATEGAEVTSSGRLFQTRAAATRKAWLTISDEDELERSRWQASTSATWQSSSIRYAGADPWRHLYMRTAYLNAICSGAFSQCSWCRSGVMCWNLELSVSVRSDDVYCVMYCLKQQVNGHCRLWSIQKGDKCGARGGAAVAQ